MSAEPTVNCDTLAAADSGYDYSAARKS